MKRDAISKINSSFLSCAKDTETILSKLFIENKLDSNILKRLLTINTKDCLSNQTSEVYKKKIEEIDLKKLIDENYIRLAPKLRFPEHEEVKSYIILTYDNFMPNVTNSPEFRDCIITFDIICHTDCWYLGDYEVRPLKIAGYIDGLLNRAKLSGIGELNFMGCNMLVLDENLSGYSLAYRAIHGSDDKIPSREE